MIVLSGLAEDFERRAPSLSLDDDRVRHYLLFARRHAGRIDEARFHQQLDALEREDTEHQVAMDIPTAIFYVHVADADGSEADLEVARPCLDQPMWSGHNEGLRGHLLFLSGRLDEALPPLERGARTCEILPTDTGAGWQGMQAFSFMHSRLWLGAALEAKGDSAGACAKYAVIEDRWKNAKPTLGDGGKGQGSNARAPLPRAALTGRRDVFSLFSFTSTPSAHHPGTESLVQLRTGRLDSSRCIVSRTLFSRRIVVSLSICAAVVLGVSAKATATLLVPDPAPAAEAPLGVVMGPGEACWYFSGGTQTCWASNTASANLSGMF